MNKVCLIITLLILQDVKAQYSNQEKCSLIIKSIFAGLGLMYQTNEINYMENLDCDGFLANISKSVELSNKQHQDQLQAGWYELGNAFGKVIESIKVDLNKDLSKQSAQLQWLISYFNNLRLKLKNTIVCQIDEQWRQIIDLLFESSFFSDQFNLFQDKQYQQYGYEVGQMFFKIQMKIVNLSSIFQDMNVALQVFNGFQFSIKDQSQITKDQLKRCLEGADQIVIYFDDFSYQVQEYMYIPYTFCFHKQIWLALNHYTNALDKCSDSITNAPILSSRLKQFHKVLENNKFLIRIDLNPIFDHARQAYICWCMGYWFGFGEELGNYLTNLEEDMQKRLQNF
ncbi:unnamed protein product (macronuclear) [Paramecium tetraurelia]|uniref:Uncharacterized protein n=1 Tax=Paramecium tetraurelia TaxID=5888 RepID=A0CCK3_PARTE|nr:uncharacterized protein GSPATT00037305001 [Paramecium tetraurelia]CAK68520.1 unnamed protein product [Paramecium tetraurelia]|eukprot:XP_001435917.1 hypothetical protein (macronuclear) [Paramecium tetraurelia strain d4-2]